MKPEPLITLSTKPEIDGTVHVANEFADLEYVAKIDLLNDWINMLEELRLFERAMEHSVGYDMNAACTKDIFIDGRPLVEPQK